MLINSSIFVSSIGKYKLAILFAATLYCEQHSRLAIFPTGNADNVDKLHA